MTTVRIMLLPPLEKDGLPQVFFEDDGIWRDMTVPQANFVTLAEIKADLEQHLSNLMSLVGGTPPAAILPENPGFRTKFRGRYDQLFPRELGDQLREVADAADAAPGAPRPELQMFMHPTVEWIPWELLHDGRSFLGLRFAVTRLPILKEPLEMGAPHDRAVSTVYSLLANNVLEDGAFADWLTTFDGFSGNGGWQHRFPSAAGVADYPSIVRLDEAKDVADIIHVTCHGGLQRGTSYYWTLDYLNRLRFDYDIDPDFAQRTTMERRPLVFGNACASNTTNFGAMHGFGSAFMIGGALNFVGTFAPITKTIAVSFARRFYRHLLGAGGGAAGLPIGQALVATKRMFKDENCQDPSYLFYCLYGPSDTTYRPA